MGTKAMRPVIMGARAAALLWFASAAGLAHEGMLDSYGCHTNLADKIYHCHTGALAGQQFKSRADMQRVLKEREKEKREKPKLEIRDY